MCAVEGRDGADAQARRCHEYLVRRIGVEDVDVRLRRVDPKLVGQVHRRLPAYAAQHELAPGRADRPVLYHEYVAAVALAQITVHVEQQCVGVRVLRPRLHVGLDQVDVVVRLRPGTHGVGRCAPDRRSNDRHAVPVVVRPLPERYREALDDDPRAVGGGLDVPARQSQPAGDPLGHPRVVALVDRGEVAFEHVHRQVGHLGLCHLRIDAHPLQRFVQPVEVLVQPEYLVPERAGSVEHGVAHDEPAVADRDRCLALRHDLAVYVCNTLLSHACLPLCGPRTRCMRLAGPSHFRSLPVRVYTQ